MEGVVIGLVSGAAGVTVAGLLQLRARRLDLLRERQIVAADDFASAANEVFVALTEQLEVAPPFEEKPDEWIEAIAAAVEAARVNVHQLTRRMHRLELLFGVGSPTAVAGVDLVAHLRRMSIALRQDLGEEETGERVTAEYNQAVDAFGRFNSNASRVLTLPLWRQWLGLRRATITDAAKSASRRLRLRDRADGGDGLNA